MKIEAEEIDETVVTLDTYNSDLNLSISGSRYTAHPLVYEGFAFMWAGARATHGASKGKFCFEVKILEHKDVSHLPADEPNPHVVRVGFSVESSTLQLGEDPLSYGYGGTGKISTNCQFKDYGSPFMSNDVILGVANMDSDPVQIGFAKNGSFQGWAYRINKNELRGKALFPHVLTKNVSFEVNFGQNDKPYFPLPDGFKDYTFISCMPLDQRESGTRAPKKIQDCEMLMMCGLPGAGKSVWAAEYSKNNPQKKYNILGTNNIIDKMKVMGLPRKRNYHGRWDVLIQMATKCLNKMFEIGSKLRRNYILDQTNVYPTAQKRKMRNFKDFKRIAIVVVPTEAEYKRRCDKRDREEGKEVPDHAVLEMKANFKLPEEGETFDEVIFTELQRQDAEQLVANYNEEGKAAVGPPRKQFKPNDQSFGSRFDSGPGNMPYSDRGGRGEFDGARGGSRGGRGGFDRNRGGFDGNRGGFGGNRGGFGGNRGGFDGNRGGFDRSRGGFDGNQGSFDGDHGGFEGNRGGFDRNRGFDGSRGGFEGNRGGFDRNRGFDGNRGGFDRSRGYDGSRRGYDGGSDNSREGFDGNSRGGYGGRGGYEGNRGGFERGRAGFEQGQGGYNSGRGSFQGGRGNFSQKRGLDDDSQNFDVSEGYGGYNEGFGFGNNSRGFGKRGRGDFAGSRSNTQDNYGSRDYNSGNDGNSGRYGSNYGSEPALGAYDRGGTSGGRGQRGYRGGSSRDYGSSRDDNSSYGSGNNTSGSYGQNPTSNFSGGYNSYQDDYSDKSQGGFRGNTDSYSRRDNSSFGSGSQGSFIKKEPGTEGVGARAARGSTRSSGRASRWSAEPSAYPDSGTSASQDSSTYSSYGTQVKTEPGSTTATPRYDSYSASSTGYGSYATPPSSNQSFQGAQAYDYQQSATNAASQPWMAAQPSAATNTASQSWQATQPSNVTTQASQDQQQQWSQYYQQQAQSSQYYNQYYGQQAAAPAYGSAYTAK